MSAAAVPVASGRSSSTASTRARGALVPARRESPGRWRRFDWRRASARSGGLTVTPRSGMVTRLCRYTRCSGLAAARRPLIGSVGSSSIGSSDRLLTDRLWVRVPPPQLPGLHVCSGGMFTFGVGGGPARAGGLARVMPACGLGPPEVAVTAARCRVGAVGVPWALGERGAVIGVLVCRLGGGVVRAGRWWQRGSGSQRSGGGAGAGGAGGHGRRGGCSRPGGRCRRR